VTLISLIVCIIATGVILGGAILFVLEFSVLSRVGRLSRRTGQIGSSGDFSGRVQIEGKDEIASLASSINTMLKALDASHTQRGARNAEMLLLMNTVPSALLSLDEQFRINPEYSRSATAILGQDALAARPFLEVLGLSGRRPDDEKKLREYLDFFKQALLPEKDMAPLNPFEELEFVRDGGRRWLRLRYYLIDRQGRPNHILAVIEDITEEKKLAEQVARSRRENLQLKAIAEDPDLFREFLVETRQIIDNVRSSAAKLDTKETSRPLVHDIFRGVHTIKGVAGSFGLFTLAEVSSKLEDSLSLLREKGAITPAAVEQTRTALAILAAMFAEIMESSKKLLGDDLDREAGVYLRIPLEELKRHMVEIKAMAIDESLKHKMIDQIKNEILARLRTLCTVPAKKGFARALKIVPGLINRLGKNAEFKFDGQDTMIDYDVASELSTPLVHLLRNALDHGVEPPEEREKRGKRARALVLLSVKHENSHLVLELSDDGRGLDHEKIKTVALKKGVITHEEGSRFTKEECHRLIFLPGFSTAEKVTEVSGRGVGMDAVLTSVQINLKGEVRIQSEVGKGTTITITVPM
jgi:two-component system chemotaxis sensor kinase CheA